MALPPIPMGGYSFLVSIGIRERNFVTVSLSMLLILWMTSSVIVEEVASFRPAM